jgi:hypothetical protein
MWVLTVDVCSQVSADEAHQGVAGGLLKVGTFENSSATRFNLSNATKNEVSSVVCASWTLHKAPKTDRLECLQKMAVDLWKPWHQTIDKKYTFLYVKFEYGLFMSFTRNLKPKKKWHFSWGNATDRTTWTAAFQIVERTKWTSRFEKSRQNQLLSHNEHLWSIQTSHLWHPAYVCQIGTMATSF